MANIIKIKRGTAANLATLASGGGLSAGELYLITDQQRLAVGLTTTTYQTFAKLSEIGGGGGSGSVTVDDIAPSSPSVGAMWLRPSDGVLSVYVATTVGSFAWVSPIGAQGPAGTSPTIGGATTQIQFNDAGVFGGDADLTWDKTNNRLGLNAVGTSVRMNAATADLAATGTAGLLDVYGRQLAGRTMLKWQDSTGFDTTAQPHFGLGNVRYVTATNLHSAASAMTAYGTQVAISGTAQTGPTLAAGSIKSSTRRYYAVTGTTAGTVAGARTTILEFFRGNAANQGGFFVVIRFGLDLATIAAQNAFVGVISNAAALTGTTNFTTSTTDAKIGMAHAANTGNWLLVNNTAGSAPTTLDLGASFPVNSLTNSYELILFCPPNASYVNYRAKNLETAVEVSGSLTTNLPAATTTMCTNASLSNNATATSVGIWVSKIYIETDY